MPPGQAISTEMSGAFRSLSWFNYRVWFAGGLVSNIGAWMQRIAEDWLVYAVLTDDQASAMGVTLALQFGPMFVLAPIGGALVDRFGPRAVLVVTQAVQAVLAFALGAMVLTGTADLWTVLIFAFALGLATTADNPARQTLVGELVPQADLTNAVALNAASFHGARLIGPAVAGVLTATIGPGWAFVINGLTFVATLVALAALRRRQLTPVARDTHGMEGMWEGVRYVVANRELVFVFVIVFLVGSLGMNFSIYTAAMARSAFGLGASAFGLLSSAVAIGSMAGALFAARRTTARFRSIVTASALFGVLCSIAALMPEYWSFAAVLVPTGVCMLLFMTSVNAYVQSTTPPPLRGRVLALYAAVLLGTTPIGAPLVGWITDTAGPRWALGFAAAMGLSGAAIGMAWLIRPSWARTSEPR